MSTNSGIRIAATGLVLGFLSLQAVGPLRAQTAQDEQKAMEMYMKLGAVNAHHAYLKLFVGEWKSEATMWVMPGAPPTTSENTAKAELILGGRFLKMVYSGTMMGQPFEGFQIVGYDNLQNKYVVLWIDNTSTAFYMTTGVYDEAKKTMTEEGLW